MSAETCVFYRRNSLRNRVNFKTEAKDLFYVNDVSVLSGMYLRDDSDIDNFESDKRDSGVFLQNADNCDDIDQIIDVFDECINAPPSFKLEKGISNNGKYFSMDTDNYADIFNYNGPNANLNTLRKSKTNEFKYMEYSLKNDCNIVYEYEEGIENRAKELAAFQRLYCVDYDQNWV